MTNNYIKITTKARRTEQEVSHLGPHATAVSYFRDTNGDDAMVCNLTWFFPVNDSDPLKFSAAVAQAGSIAESCKSEFGRHFRGCQMSVYRDFPGNSLPVVGGKQS